MQYRLSIPAGSVQAINCSDANYFAVVLSGVDLMIALPGSEFELFGQGDSLSLNENRTFKRLEVRNPSISDANVIIYAGRDRYEQRRQSVIDAPSEARSVATTIPANTTLTLSGTPTGSQIRRKSILVSNQDSALDLQILAENGAVLDTVFFRTSAIVNMSGPIGVRNNNGSPVTASVTEVWWTVAT